MKTAKIISAFTCRITRKLYNIGEVVEFSDERYNELIAKNKIEPHGKETSEGEAEVLKKPGRKKKYQ